MVVHHAQRKARRDSTKGRNIRRLREEVAEAVIRLVAAPDYRQGVAHAITALRTATDADRVYLLEHHSDPEVGEPVASLRFGWSRTAGGVRIDPPELQNVRYTHEGMRRIHDLLSQGSSVYGAVREFPEEERRVLEQFDIRSLLVLPIFYEGRLWGALGFDDCRREREWSQEERDILSMVGMSFGVVLERERARERYRALLEGVDAVLWEAEAPSLRYTFVSRRAEALFGYPLSDWFSQPGFLAARAHPEDRERALAAYHEAVRSGEPQDLEYRVITSGGGVMWVRDQMRATRNSHGRPLRLHGVTANTTSQKHIEQSRARLAAIIEATPDVVGITDLVGRNHYLNLAGRRLLGIGDKEDLPETYPADCHPDWALRVIAEVAAPTAAREGVWSGETALLTRDGREVPVSQVVLAHKTPGGEIECYSTIARDISARKRYEGQITALLDLARVIGGTLDLEEILGQATRRTAALVPCDRVIVFHWDPDRFVTRLVAQHGVPDHLLQEAVDFEYPLSADIIARMAGGESLVVNEPDVWPSEVRNLLDHFEVASLVVVPLNVRRKLLGALAGVQNKPGGPFDALQVQFLEGVAAHLSLAMDAADLHRRQQQEIVVSQALARVGQEMIASLNNPYLLERLCKVTVEVLACECSHTLWYDEKKKVCVVVAGYGDAPEEWERIGRSSLEPDAFFDFRSTSEEVKEIRTAIGGGLRKALQIAAGLVVALRRGGECVGLQVAGYRSRERPFTETQRRIAVGIARLASMALANTRLVEELKQANRLKADFVATMSHELRTPLNVIIGYNDLLLEGAFGAVTREQADTLRRMNRSAWELLDLINATLDVSRIESGQVPVELKDIDLAEFMSQIESETQEMRAKPGVEFEWSVSPTLPVLRSDPVKLKVVIKNLISNAVKFTDGGRVTVTVRQDNDGVGFQVVDTGIGISHEMLDVIFHPFRQIDGSLTRRHGGVGLGLYIARRLLELIGGRVSVSSELGRGSCFRVWVPQLTDASGIPDTSLVIAPETHFGFPRAGGLTALSVEARGEKR